MAYILETELNAYQTLRAQTEMKTPKHGVIPFVLEQTPLVQVDMDTVEKIKNANGRSVDISAIKESTPTVASAFSYTIPALYGETDKTTVTIYNLWTGFHFNALDFANNAIAAEQFKLARIQECDKALSKEAAEILLSVLDTRRTQVLTDTGAPTGVAFDGTADALEIALAQQSNPFFDYINTILAQNDIDGDAMAVASHSIGHILANHRLYGANNDKNLLGQSFPSIKGEASLTPTAGSNATAYVVKAGAIGLFPSYPIEFASGGAGAPADVKFGVGSVALPMSGLKPLLYEEVQKFDGTALGTARPTAAMTYKTIYGIGLSFGVVTSYNSDLANRVNDIVKVELLSA